MAAAFVEFGCPDINKIHRRILYQAFSVRPKILALLGHQVQDTTTQLRECISRDTPLGARKVNYFLVHMVDGRALFESRFQLHRLNTDPNIASTNPLSPRLAKQQCGSGSLEYNSRSAVLDGLSRLETRLDQERNGHPVTPNSPKHRISQIR